MALLQRPHIEEALRRLDGGAETKFADSIKYDLVSQGIRYPPKRVTGLALELMTGRSFGPKSFKGGDESACFRAIRRSGFTITPKVSNLNHMLIADFAEVVSLQTIYNSANTQPMQRRGELVRTVIPNHLRANVTRFEPLFTSAGYLVEIEGSDGIGLKGESPWIRVYDPTR